MIATTYIAIQFKQFFYDTFANNWVWNLENKETDIRVFVDVSTQEKPVLNRNKPQSQISYKFITPRIELIISNVHFFNTSLISNTTSHK